MNRFSRGLLIAGLHVVLVGGLGAKLLVDRARYPRLWVKAAPASPPIGGRYVGLRLELPARDFEAGAEARWAALRVEEGELLALPAAPQTGQQVRISPDGTRATLSAPIPFFVSEQIAEATRR